MTLLKNPSHPGEVLLELYLHPLDLSAISLAQRQIGRASCRERVSFTV